MAQRSTTISRLANFPERLARMITDWAGSSQAFLTAVGRARGLGGHRPLFHYSDSWQLVINTGTTIVTFSWCSSSSDPRTRMRTRCT
jgi:low affinity Fe/Cu permease